MENRYVYEKEVDDVNHGVYFKITDFETLETVIFKDVNLGDYKSEDDFSNQCKLFDDTFAFSCKSLNNLDKGELVVDNTEKLDKGLVKLLEAKDLFDVLEKDKTVDVDNKKDDMEAVNTEITKYKVGDIVRLLETGVDFEEGDIVTLLGEIDKIGWECLSSNSYDIFIFNESEFEPIKSEDIEYKVDNNELVVDKKDMSNKGGCIVNLDEEKKTINEFIENNYYGDKESAYEAIKIINNLNLNFNRGNVLKYILRAGKKNEDKEIEDLIKAKNYIDYEIERLKIMNEH